MENVGVVVVVGGDGILNVVVFKLMGMDIFMGILFLGIFNYVVWVLNILLDLLDVVKVISEG